VNFWKRLGARKYFAINQTLKLEKLEGSKPDDIAITGRKVPFSWYKLSNSLKLVQYVHPYSASAEQRRVFSYSRIP
jgi:hypothetical protein